MTSNRGHPFIQFAEILNYIIKMYLHKRIRKWTIIYSQIENNVQKHTVKIKIKIYRIIKKKEKKEQLDYIEASHMLVYS